MFTHELQNTHEARQSPSTRQFLSPSDTSPHCNKLLPPLQAEDFGKFLGLIITFTMILVPRIHTVLEPIANQCIVNTHVTMAEEGIAFTGS